jgi:long-chain acyl-CoA synthetase
VRDQEEIEAHYCRSPFIKEVCLIERCAVVVPEMQLMRRRRIVNIGDLLRFELEGLSHMLPPHQRADRHEIWFDALPRTATQEIDRPEVERRLRTPVPEIDQAWLDDAHAAAVVSAVRPFVKGHASIRPDANLEIDLGLDSIERVELLTELEHRFGTAVSTAADILTVRQLAEAFRGGRAGATTLGEPWSTILRERPAMNWLLRKRTFAAPLVWLMLRVVRMLLVRVRVTGLDRLPASGPYIISPNHQSYVDPFVLCSVLPYGAFRNVFFLGAPEYFETPFTRWVARTTNLVSVDPDSNLVPALQAGVFGLTHGKILLLFPEGERSIDGTVKKFKKGAPILAQQLGVPVVPVALKGIHEMWPRNRGINWRLVAPWSGHRVAIEFGEPMVLPATANYGDSAVQLRSRVTAMWEALST